MCKLAATQEFPLKRGAPSGAMMRRVTSWSCMELQKFRTEIETQYAAC